MYSILPCAPSPNQFPNSSAWAGGEQMAMRHESNPRSRANWTICVFCSRRVVAVDGTDARLVARFTARLAPRFSPELSPRLRHEFYNTYQSVRLLPRRRAVRVFETTLNKPCVDFPFATKAVRCDANHALAVSLGRLSVTQPRRAFSKEPTSSGGEQFPRLTQWWAAGQAPISEAGRSPVRGTSPRRRA